MTRRPVIPEPAHPTERRQPLPWEKPKSATEEAEAEARLQAIMQNPSYAEADRDIDFLHTDGIRSVRLQLDYLKAEEILSAHGIERTIVIFGSTRLREPDTARNELSAAHHEATAHPGDEARQRALRLAERRMDLSRYYEIGRELGRLVGAVGDPRLAVMTGGGPGGMEAANRGAYDAGAKTVGLNITLPREQYPNPYLTPGLCLQFHYFALRKLHFMKRAAAIVALPGGFGTLDELFGALTLIQTRKTAPIPVVLIGEAYWRGVFDVDFLAEAGSIDEEDRELFWFAESAQEAWDGIVAWHKLNGSPLFEAAE
ncbi:cytochrome D ubiquinol oxidase subunit II [Acidihalobacter aeolianus]|uniref:AMP nucleosidase n=1 Tax=Acidihalobacter aeolianus TaxID=2792603 RepID=A0A1D8K793_9GAMM|nr:LOG family protein [Acidihalobacter aeolianus]AOV16806.1 cytochrome D ubiquinol oxidase subunit II [Acidihalobacter aeolianus]